MTTPQPDDTGNIAEFETVLADAMDEFARRFQPPQYPPGAFRMRSHRTPPWLTRRSPALLAAASILVLGGVVATTVGVYRSANPASPGAGGPGPHPWTGSSLDNPGPGIAMTTIFAAAVKYENPATAAQVDLTTVKSFFKDGATFESLWGRDALGVTCGQHADSYTINGARIDFFADGKHLPISAAIVFTVDETRISDVLCAG